MTEAEKYFLVVAEELNMAKAAQKLYVSHQNISQHIRNLEKQYGTQLIIRKPRMELTAAGRELAATLANVQVLENQLRLRINEREKGFCGEVSIGMPHARSSILVPAIIERYYSEFPNVKVIFSEAHSDKLAHLVLKGSLDMFVGVQYAYFPRLEYESLLDEKLYLTINGGKLREIFGNGFPEILKQFSEGVDVAQFLHQPFAMNLAGSVFRGGMDDFLNREGVKLHTVFENGDQELQLELCRRGMTISFCTQMHLYMARRLNEAALPDERIYVFPVNRMTMCNRLYLIRHRDAYFPPHKERMRQIACEVVRQFQLLDSDDFMEFELQ